jgi:anti-sigma28 factor (negative regulator of flagellin synthesis)
MKTLTTALVLSLSLIGVSAQAADLGHDKTRAEVVSELQQAKADGSYTFGNLEYPAPIAQRSSLTRAEVQSELAAAQNNGEVTFGTLDYPPQVAQTGATESRAQVVQELRQAKADGTYTFGTLDYPPTKG